MATPEPPREIDAAGVDLRVIIVAPFGRDAQVLAQVLTAARIASTVCATAAALGEELAKGAGALLLTEEALTEDAVATVLTALGAQPAWSDVPLVLLLGRAPRARFPGRERATVSTLRARANVTPLERPAREVTLVTALRTALRARARQYAMRELMARENEARQLAQAAQARAEEASRLKDDFLATVSHELRTPLSAVLLWTRLAAHGRLDPSQIRDALVAIEHGAEAQSRLIEDLLDTARITSGKLHLAPSESDMRAIATRAADVVRAAADAKGIALRVDVEEAGTLRVDAERIQQVLWNLLNNAVKFTPAGGEVQLRVERTATLFVAEVSDNGQGIAPEFLPHVFDRFRQADASSRRAQSGLGLGLSISHQLVEMHGGTLRAESRGEGHGATFRVELPIAARSKEPPATSPKNK